MKFHFFLEPSLVLLDVIVVAVCSSALLFCWFAFVCCLIVQLSGNNLVNLVNLTIWAKQQKSRISTYRIAFRILLTIDKSDISTHLQFSLTGVIYSESPSLQGSFMSLQKGKGGEA